MLLGSKEGRSGRGIVSVSASVVYFAVALGLGLGLGPGLGCCESQLGSLKTEDDYCEHDLWTEEEKAGCLGACCRTTFFWLLS